MLLSINGKVFSLATKNRLLVTYISANNNDKLHSLSLTTGHLSHMKKIYNRLIPKIIPWINAMLYCFPISVVDLLVLKIFYIAVDRETNQGNPNLHLFSVQSGEIIKSLIQKKQSNW